MQKGGVLRLKLEGPVSSGPKLRKWRCSDRRRRPLPLSGRPCWLKRVRPCLSVYSSTSRSMSTSRIKSKYDVVILGAGHNGLVAASYLGRAGLSVLLLEKNDYIGGASTSPKVFPDYHAWLLRYSYLLSLFPEKTIPAFGS